MSLNPVQSDGSKICKLSDQPQKVTDTITNITSTALKHTFEEQSIEKEWSVLTQSKLYLEALDLLEKARMTSPKLTALKIYTFGYLNDWIKIIQHFERDRDISIDRQTLLLVNNAFNHFSENLTQAAVLADFYFESYSFKEALDYYEKANKGNHLTPVQCAKRLECFYYLDRQVEFEKQVSDLNDSFPDKAILAYLKGLLLYKKNSMKEAREAIENSLKIESSVRATLLYGHICDALGEDELAKEIFQSLQKQYPNDPEIVTRVVLYLSTRPVLFEFVKEISHIFPDEFLQNFHKLFEMHPHHLLLRVAQGLLYFYNKSQAYKTPATAIKAFDDCLTKIPNGFDGLLYAFKGAFLYLHREQEADTSYKTAIKIAPFSALIWLKYGLFKVTKAQEKKVNDQTIEIILRKALILSKSKELTFAILLLISSLSESRLVERKLEDFEELIKLDPYVGADVYISLIDLYIYKALPEKAIELAKSLINKLNSKELQNFVSNRHHSKERSDLTCEEWKERFLYLAYQNLAMAYDNSKNDEEALNSYEAGLKLITSHASFEFVPFDTILYLFLLLRNNKLEKAQEVCETLISKHAQLLKEFNFFADISLILALFQNKQITDALEELDHLSHDHFGLDLNLPQSKALRDEKKRKAIAQAILDKEKLEDERKAKEEADKLKRTAQQKKESKLKDSLTEKTSPGVLLNLKETSEREKKEKEAKVAAHKEAKLSKNALKRREVQEKLEMKKASQSKEEATQLITPSSAPAAPPAPVLALTAPSSSPPARRQPLPPIQRVADTRNFEQPYIKPAEEVLIIRKKERGADIRPKNPIPPMSEALIRSLKYARGSLIDLGDLMNRVEKRVYDLSKSDEMFKVRFKAMYHILKICEALSDTSSRVKQALMLSKCLEKLLMGEVVVEEVQRKIHDKLELIMQLLALASSKKPFDKDISLNQLIVQVKKRIWSHGKKGTNKADDYVKVNDILKDLLRGFPRNHKLIDQEIDTILNDGICQLSLEEIKNVDLRLIDTHELNTIRTEIRTYSNFISDIQLLELAKTLSKSTLLENIDAWLNSESLSKSKVSDLPCLCQKENKRAWNVHLKDPNPFAVSLLFKMMYDNFDVMDKLMQKIKTDFRSYWLEEEEVRVACKMAISNIRKSLTYFNEFGLLYRFQGITILFQENKKTFPDLITLGNRVGHILENGDLESEEDISIGDTYEIAKQSQDIKIEIRLVQETYFPATIFNDFNLTIPQLINLRDSVPQDKLNILKTNLTFLKNIYLKFHTFEKFEQNALVVGMAKKLWMECKKSTAEVNFHFLRLLENIHPGFCNPRIDEPNTQMLFRIISNADHISKILFEQSI